MRGTSYRTRPYSQINLDRMALQLALTKAADNNNNNNNNNNNEHQT